MYVPCMKHATPRQTEPDQMTDLTLSATFANEAQEDIARADEETRSKFKAGWIKSASIDAAASGVASFNDAWPNCSPASPTQPH